MHKRQFPESRHRILKARIFHPNAGTEIVFRVDGIRLSRPDLGITYTGSMGKQVLNSNLPLCWFGCIRGISRIEFNHHRLPFIRGYVLRNRIAEK